MKSHILAGLFFLFIVLVPSAIRGQNYRTSDGYDFSVSLTADKRTIMLGETTFLSFEVKNLSETRLSFGDGADYRNNIGRPTSYQVTVVSDDGKSVPQPKVTFSMGGLYGARDVPVNGSYVRKLFLPHWATFERPGTYNVTVERTLSIAGTEPALPPFKDHKVRPITTKATTKLTVISTDNDRLGAVIRDLGMKMNSDSETDDARDYVQLLEFIKDTRTIEFWTRAVDTYSRDAYANGSHRFAQTPSILATYDTPEAWSALKFAMTSRSDDVRRDVASALGSSNNKQALPLLLSMQDDSYWFVRLRVAQRLADEKDEAATAVLLKLLNDENQSVWETAELELKARNRMPQLQLRELSALKCSIRLTKAVKAMQVIGSQSDGNGGSGGVFTEYDCASALDAFLSELSDRRAANEMLGEAWVLYQIGDIYRDSRRYQQARENYELALPLFRTLKNVAAQRELLSELASVSQSLDKFADALKYLEEELSSVRSSSNKSVRSDEGRILERISDLHFASGDNVAGIDFLFKRLDWQRKQKSHTGQFDALKALGKAYEGIGKKNEALSSYELALASSKKFTPFITDWYEDEITQLKADIQRLKR